MQFAIVTKNKKRRKSHSRRAGEGADPAHTADARVVANSATGRERNRLRAKAASHKRTYIVTQLDEMTAFVNVNWF